MKQKNQIEENARLNILETLEVQHAVEKQIEQYKTWRDSAKDCEEFNYWNNSYNRLMSANSKLKLQEELRTTLFNIK